jgi:hypothetical protein
VSAISLSLYDTILGGNGLIADCSALFADTWRRSIRRIGGYWLGTCEIKADRVGLGWSDDFFDAGLLREIREQGGGEETWRGALVKMEYTRGGDMFVRDVSSMANAIRSIYTSIGNNLLTNGSGETGAWTAYNSATVTQDSAWVTHGAYSIKIVVADTTIRGATVQTGITIAAGRQYLLRASTKVTSGSWRIAVNRSDNDASLCYFSTGGSTGEMGVDVSIPESNIYSGTVIVRITSEAAAGTINVDAMVFQSGPMRAETGWYIDTASIAVHGRKEDILLRGGKGNADANAECQSLLIDEAWTNPGPPKNSQTWLTQTREDVLRLTFAGYWAMLNWIYTTLHGTRSCSQWVTDLTALQSTYVQAGIIDSNALDYYVDDRAPLRVGDVLRQIAEAGGSGGAKWSIGVYAGRQLKYESVPQALSYYRRNGQLISVAGGEIEPWLAKPGWAVWQDMPIGAGTLTGNAQNDPRWVYLEEIEMLPDGAIAFKLG